MIQSMSDYIYTNKSGQTEALSASIKKIYLAYDIECQEFSGAWGSLSVSPSPYQGLQPLETESHICVVLGGPIFYFCDNDFLTGSNPTEGTQALLERFLSHKLDLVNDISGPFQLVVIDKVNNTVTCMTDLMLFIPAYAYEGDGKALTFGSHVDAVARVTGKVDDLDKASVADFILHGVVTYPYTVFSGVHQMHPATEYRFSIDDNQLSDKNVAAPYWLPHEEGNYTDLDSAAESLREGVAHHVNTITKPMSHVAQFISGGEDSRTLLSLMPERLKRDGYIFLDSMNREGKIAQKVANAYGANFNLGKRDPLHYLDIVDEATALVGRGHQYTHCHSLRFDRELSLNTYSAVFGGYSSDVFLKGHFARKTQTRQKLTFLPQVWLKGEGHSQPVSSALFADDILNETNRRRATHVERIRGFRPETLHEWFSVWPSTMRQAMPNHYCNRRLFASYEVFMSHEVVKVSACVPTEWKLNRKLFHTAFQPCLAKSRWIRHGDGRLPYFSQSINLALTFTRRLTDVIKHRLLREPRKDGAWPSWKSLATDRHFDNTFKKAIDSLHSANLIELNLHDVTRASTKTNIIALASQMASHALPDAQQNPRQSTVGK